MASIYRIPPGKYTVCDDTYFGEHAPADDPLTRLSPDQFVLRTVLGAVTYEVVPSKPGTVHGTHVNCDYGRLGVYPDWLCAPAIANDRLIARLAESMQWFVVTGDNAVISHDDGIFTITDGVKRYTIDTVKRGSDHHALWLRLTNGDPRGQLSKKLTLKLALAMELHDNPN